MQVENDVKRLETDLAATRKRRAEVEASLEQHKAANPDTVRCRELKTERVAHRGLQSVCFSSRCPARSGRKDVLSACLTSATTTLTFLGLQPTSCCRLTQSLGVLSSVAGVTCSGAGGAEQAEEAGDRGVIQAGGVPG